MLSLMDAPSRKTAEMHRFHICLVLVILGTGRDWISRALAQDPAPRVREELVQMADRWKVPQPGPNARICRIVIFRSGNSDQCTLGFVEADKPGQALVGFQYFEIPHPLQVEEIPDPHHFSIANVRPRNTFYKSHGVNETLVTGTQLLRSGNEQMGALLISAGVKEATGHGSLFYSPAGEDPVLMLARSCLAHAMNELISQRPDFRGIKQRIELLIADQPGLKSEELDWVLQGLQASIDYEPSPEGSIDRIVDDFLLAGGSESALSGRIGKFRPAERALILKGFEAIPALIRQRASPRLTNYQMQGFNNFPSYPMTAGMVIEGYLQRFANRRFDSTWLDMQWGTQAPDDTVLKWWESASATGEDEYIRQNTVLIDEIQKVSLSQELLLLAEERYPALLPDICKKILTTSSSSVPVYEAIVRTTALSRDEKLALLEQGVQTDHQDHRNGALAFLQDLDPAGADKYLLRFLEESPSTARVDYWIDQNANLGRYVSRSIDAGVWQAFHDLLERADLGMRMQLIHHLFPPRDAPDSVLGSFHAIYLRFWGDETVRDESTNSKYAGPGAGFPYKRIAMQDFVSMHWASWLALELEPPEVNADSGEWKTYRDAVGVAVGEWEAKRSKDPSPE